MAATRERIVNRMELSAERTMREIARLSYFDPRKLFDETGAPLPITELDDDTAAALAGFQTLGFHRGFRSLITPQKRSKRHDQRD